MVDLPHPGVPLTTPATSPFPVSLPLSVCVCVMVLAACLLSSVRLDVRLLLHHVRPSDCLAPQCCKIEEIVAAVVEKIEFLAFLREAFV